MSTKAKTKKDQRLAEESKTEKVTLISLWNQFWTDLRADNIAATANHRQANRGSHFNPHQHKKLKGWMKK